MSLDVGDEVSGRGADQTIVVRPEWLHGLAQRVENAGQDIAAARLEMLGYLHDTEVALAARLDPLGAAEFEHSLRLALDGVGSLAACAAQAADLREVIADAITQYERAEHKPSFWHRVGSLVDRAATGVWSDSAHTVRAAVHLAPAAWHTVRDIAHGAGVQSFFDLVSDDQDLVHVLHSGMATGSGLSGLSVPGPEALIAREYDDGTTVLAALGSDHDYAAAVVPRSVGDVVGELAHRDDGPGGSVDVRLVAGKDGRRAVIVDITGMKTLNPSPANSNIANLGSDLLAIDGTSSSYERGVFKALEDAGVRADEPIMLVGHSLGGMVAVNVAKTAAESGRFNVTHVITAGSPIARTVGDLPRSVQVLALENEADPIPKLDGQNNPNRRNITTVHADVGGVGTGAHGLANNYVPIAEGVSSKSSGSAAQTVQRFVSTADEFFDGESIDTEQYIVSRHLSRADPGRQALIPGNLMN